MKLYILFAIFAIFQASCSINSSLTLTGSKSVDVNTETPVMGNSADTIYGEKVITTLGTPGFQLQADFYESAETQTLSNGYKIEAVFQ